MEDLKPLIIFDTDMDTDCDDAGALAMLAQAHLAGKIELLGIVADSMSAYAAPCCQAMADYYGLQLPVGAIHVQDYWSADSGTERFGEYVALSESCVPRGISYNRVISDQTEKTKGKTDKDYLSAAAFYRKVLVGAPDQSVTVLCVGMLTALTEALASGPDAISQDTGAELFRKKVKQVVAMANPTKVPDFNWGMDAVGAQQFLELCPVPVRISADGGAIITGEKCSDRMPPEHPVRRAYEQWLGGRNRGRSSWDLVATLYAITPDTPYLEERVMGKGRYHSAEKRFEAEFAGGTERNGESCTEYGAECYSLHVTCTDQKMAEVLTGYMFGEEIDD